MNTQSKEKLIQEVGLYESNIDLNNIDINKSLYKDGCFYDSDTCCFGYFNDLKSVNFEDCIKEYKNNIDKEFKEIYKTISTDEYMDKIVGIMDEYNSLVVIIRKYRHQRRGNPDVDKYLEFCDKYSFEIRNSKYDIGASNIVINGFKNGAHTTTFYNRRRDLTKDERREMMQAAIDSIKEDYYMYFENDLTDIKETYKELVSKINDLLINKDGILLIALPGAKINKNIKELNIKDFSIDEYVKANSFIYRIRK